MLILFVMPYNSLDPKAYEYWHDATAAVNPDNLKARDSGTGPGLECSYFHGEGSPRIHVKCAECHGMWHF